MGWAGSMKNREEQRIELAQKIEKLGTRYFDAVRTLQHHLTVIGHTRALTGTFPQSAKDELVELYNITQRIHIRILRARANMLEFGLSLPFTDESMIAPDKLPEDW